MANEHPLRPVSDDHRHEPADYEQTPDAVLAACPFCGCDEIARDSKMIGHSHPSYRCGYCGVRTATYSNEAAARAAWNRRPDPAPKSAPPASGDDDDAPLFEVVHRIREGTFYDDYDWAAGPALRTLDAALEAATQPPADHSSEIERLRARVGALEEALKPFSMEYHADEPDHWPAFGKEAGKGWPTVGDFRLARALTADSEPADHSRGGVLADIQRERARQTREEGWALDHDDAHDGEELARAAACYATGVQLRHFEREYERGYYRPVPLRVWPWSDLAWNPGNDRRRQLVKAGALIVAEIERLDRLTPTAPIPESAGEPATRKANNERDRTNTAPVGRPGERSHPAVRSGNALRPEALETPPKPAPGDVAGLIKLVEGARDRAKTDDMGLGSLWMRAEEWSGILAALTTDSDAKPQGGEVGDDC